MISPTDLAGKSVYVVDANSLIFQVFHALPEMSSPTGQPVGAVFGFARDIIFLRQKRPDFLLFAFDPPGGTLRHEWYAEYKAQRGDMPEELAMQFPEIKRVLEALHIPILECPNYEADDVLATVARLCDEHQAHCLIVTSDKDCRQLISDHVQLYNVRKDQVFGRDALQAEWGIAPEQVVDFQALVGDAVDNVPGVPLIGPKIAKELLAEHGTLENVLAHAEEVSGKKRRENLIQYREQALLSKRLVRLYSDCPIDVDWEAARCMPVDVRATVELFQGYGFHSLREQIAVFGDGEPEAQPAKEVHYHTVDTEEALRDLVKDLEQQTSISLDTETTSLCPRGAVIVGYAIAWEPGEAYYIPVRGPLGDRHLPPDAVREALRPVLENPAIEKIGQNLKYDQVVLRAAGIQLAGVGFDCMVASYLLNAGERNHNLDELAKRYLNHTTVKISELIGTGKKQKRMDEVPVELVTEYAGEDVDIPLQLRPLLEAGLKEQNLYELFETLEIPLIDVLAELEFNGITLDVPGLKKLSKEYARRLEELQEQIYGLAGHEFNIASPKQLAKVLFEERGLPVVKKTKTGASTDAEVLETLAQQDPLPAKIVEYRQYAKLKNTYLDALPAMVLPATGRIHASFHQAVAATGRLSSSDPNLQNIPIRQAAGREIRSAFLPGKPDWKLLAADYSQVELRVLAHFSEDERLKEAFERDEDIHAMVASQVNGVPLDEVTSEMRRQAKAVNFGVIYGQSAFGLSKQLGIPQEEAAQFIDTYFGQYPGVEEFLAKTLAECSRNGYVTTLSGRRRMIQGVRSPSENGPSDHRPSRSRRQLALPERTAINTVIQGSAADLIKLSMISLHHRAAREGWRAKMLLQIHDELVFELPQEDVSEFSELVKEEMVGVMELKVPLRVDVKVGGNWGECE